MFLKKNLIPLENKMFKNLKFVNSDGEIFMKNLILDLENNLLNEPIIFCPTVTNDDSLIKIKIKLQTKLINLAKNLLMIL